MAPHLQSIVCHPKEAAKLTTGIMIFKHATKSLQQNLDNKKTILPTPNTFLLQKKIYIAS